MSRPEIAALERALAAERINFATARDTLNGLLGPDPTANLIGHAEEYGIDDALRAVRAEPKRFELNAAPSEATVARLRQPLTNAYEACHDMDEIVFKRETLLMAADPKHQQVLIHQGREFVLDRENTVLRWLDGAAPEKIAVQRKPDYDGDHDHDDDRQM